MGDTTKSDIDRALFENLVELGCCKLCCLRYLGERFARSYLHPVETLQKKNLIDINNEEENPPKVKKSNVCVACLGLLQEELRGEIINKIISDVMNADYDCTEFSCALSMPVSFSLRTHSLNLHVRNKFPGVLDDGSDPQIATVKDVWKWVAASEIEKGIHKTFQPKECDFSITVNIAYENDEEECNCLVSMHKDVFDVRRKQKRKFKDCFLSRKSAESLLLTTEPDQFQKHYPTPPNVPNVPVTCSSVSVLHNSLFVAGTNLNIPAQTRDRPWSHLRFFPHFRVLGAGRYNKFSRKLSQTPWIINGERTMENSVQELLCNPIMEIVKAQELRFASSGREDVDVRMLGKGRPFVCEFINPRRVQLKPQQFRAIEKQISSSTKDVSVKHLQVVSKDQVAQVKAGEEDKVKTYSAYCIVLGEEATVDWDRLQTLPSKCPIILKQKTPIRVLHRRSLATRERSIFRLEICKPETNHPKAFVLKLATQAGTYVKEFVHGDFGRTSPSLRDLLGCDVDILALDVMDIELDWPPEIIYDDNQ